MFKNIFKYFRCACIQICRAWSWADTRFARWLVLYGIFLILAGFIGYLSNPEKAKTAILSGGTFGGLSILWGLLIAKGHAWSRRAAAITTGFLTVVFAWRAVVGWTAVADGRSDKLFASVLISLMLTASILMLAGFRRTHR